MHYIALIASHHLCIALYCIVMHNRVTLGVTFTPKFLSSIDMDRTVFIWDIIIRM